MEKIPTPKQATVIPTKIVGPIKIIGAEVNEEISVPLASFEKPLWPSVNRGALISRLTKGITVTIISDSMTRSVLVEAPDAQYAQQIISELSTLFPELEKTTKTTSSYAKLIACQPQLVGNLLFLRFAFHTGEAAGHNMTTKASEALLNWLLAKYQQLKYVSISGNYCTDKKVSAVNSILGRGKRVIAEIIIPKEICQQKLRTSPQQIVELNVKKNLIGSIISGGVCSANAHFANILLALYLATGQDAANIVEGSQGITHAQLHNDDLYFSVTIPNIIVGTIGNGKELAFVCENLQTLGCLKEDGQNSRRLAIIAAASVLCGELSLLAAQTNPNELMRSHKIERQKNILE